MDGHRESKWMKYALILLIHVVTILLTLTRAEVWMATTNDDPIGTVNTTETTNPPIVYTYECPAFCSCHYDPPSFHLKISCRRSTTSTHHRLITISNGVQRLGLNHVTLNYFTILGLTPPGVSDRLLELSLHHVKLDPIVFITSELFKKTKFSLRRLRLSEIEVIGSTSVLETLLEEPIVLRSHFSNLSSLDSLIISHCSSSIFSRLILSAVPPITHLSIYNSSLSTLVPTTFSHLGQNLQSLNLSSNEITFLPWGLLAQLQSLTSLDLSANHLVHLQEEVFAGLKSLRKLNVSLNHIQYIDADVFTPLVSLHSLDLSGNTLIQIFEPYFERNIELRTLIMRKTWGKGSFVRTDTATRSNTEMDKLLDTLMRVEMLDLRDNQMRNIPETLSHLPHLRKVFLSGNSWDCSCVERWIEDWIQTYPIITIDGVNSTSQIACQDEKPLDRVLESLACPNTSITARSPRKYYGLQGTSKTLKCHEQRKEGPKVYWILPRTEVLLVSSHSVQLTDNPYHQVLSNGDLLISNLTARSFGLYTCIAEYPNLNITHFIHLGMDTSIFLDVKLTSILVGWLTSFGFLMTVLTIQLIRLILRRCGIDCPNVTGPYKVRRIKKFFENMEQHKNTQLVWLRDNYNQQVKRVKDNCVFQVERIRESYTVQTKNFSDIRDYGAQQLHTVRDQYHDQIRRVSTYSNLQLCKVRENYVFQRNRVGKFSSHQMLRLRETYKWQAQTVNKILENLPKTLNFDTCRGVGASGRSDSMYLDEEMSEIQSDGLLLHPRHLEGHTFLQLPPLPKEDIFFHAEHIALLIPGDHDKEQTDDPVINFAMGDGPALPEARNKEENEDEEQKSLTNHHRCPTECHEI